MSIGHYREHFKEEMGVKESWKDVLGKITSKFKRGQAGQKLASLLEEPNKLALIFEIIL